MPNSKLFRTDGVKSYFVGITVSSRRRRWKPILSRCEGLAKTSITTNRITNCGLLLCDAAFVPQSLILHETTLIPATGHSISCIMQSTCLEVFSHYKTKNLRVCPTLHSRNPFPYVYYIKQWHTFPYVYYYAMAYLQSG
jgi:hypothetical protein